MSSGSRRTVAFVLGGLLCVGLIAAAVVLLASGGSGTSASADSAAPFSPHYGSLAERRAVARVPTMMETMGSPAHFHPHLAVYVDGRQIVVPADIGIDPDEDPMQMAGLHTHDDSGTIHDEGMAHSRLGQFFAVWGVAFSSGRLGPYRAGGSNVVQMWVDGKPSRAFGALPLADGQQIVVSYGPERAAPPETTGA